MKIEELIRKYDLSLIRRDGKVGIKSSRKLTKREETEVLSNKEEIRAELLRRESEVKEREAKEKARLEEEKRAVEAGEKKIRVEWREGEYLSGYTVSGETWAQINVARRLLEKTGTIKDVPGWGYLVSEELVRALGEEFTYPQVLEFIRPAQEEKAKKEAQKKAEREKKFEEARKTGRPIELSRVAVECDGSVPECSLDIITTFALPNGETKEERIHTH